MATQDEIKSMKMQGDMLLQENRFDEAKQLFSRVVASDSNDAEAWLRLSSINGRLGNLDEAAECCRCLIHLCPDSCDAYVNLGNVLLLQGKLDEAIVQYNFALRLVPDYPLAVSNLSSALSRLGKDDEALACSQRIIDLKADFLDADIIVFAPGKVGSITVAHSIKYFLNSAPPTVPVYHAHYLRGFDEREAYVKARFPNPASSLEKIAADREVRRAIDNNPAQKSYVITLTREPVARAISLIFQMLDDFFPDWKSKYEQGQLDLYEVQAEMVKMHPDPSDWYDMQIKPLFDIDVYSSPFPHQQGYEIYDGRSKSKLLLIRLEDLGRIGKQAIYDFFNINNFVFIQSNTGETKEYSSLYSEFKKMPLPKSFLEGMYTSRYARHFYTEQEINEFYQRWARQQP